MKSIPHKRTIYAGITLIWVGIIFSFSLQPADASSELSSGLGKWLLETFLPWISGEMYDFFHFILRKAAHFTEYMILGVLSMLTMLQTDLKRKKMPGFLFGVIVAAIDETMQLFVEGRSGQATDVVLDSAGVLTGIFIIYLWKTILRKKYKK